MVIISGKIQRDDYRDGWQVIVDKIEDINEVKKKYAKGFEVKLDERHQSIFPELYQVLADHKGICPVKISYSTKRLIGSAPLIKEVSVNPEQSLIDAINALTLTQASKIHYH